MPLGSPRRKVAVRVWSAIMRIATVMVSSSPYFLPESSSSFFIANAKRSVS